MICEIEYCIPDISDHGKLVKLGFLCTKHYEKWEEYCKNNNLIGDHKDKDFQIKFRKEFMAFKQDESKIAYKSAAVNVGKQQG